MRSSQFSPNAGIAIGPILFVLAILGLIAGVMSSGNSNFGSASIADRVAADIQSQANLIRAKINECNIKHGTNLNYDGYPSSDVDDGILVSAMECEGDPDGSQNIWTGVRASNLPPPTAGFGPWHYINTNGAGLGGSPTGGRCIWIEPTSSSPRNNAGLVAGLTKAASKFTSSSSFSTTAEVVYDPSSVSQKFVLWISLPTGTPDPHCLP